MEVESQFTDQGHLSLAVTFDRADLKLEYSLIGIVVYLADCPTAGEPGSPALPQCHIRVALPPQSKLIQVQADARETMLISNELLPIAPQQRLRSGQKREADVPAYHRPNEEERYHNQEPNRLQEEKRPFVEPFPIPPYSPPDPRLYAEASSRPVAQLVGSAQEGLTPVVMINLNPVKLNADGLLEFSPRIDLILSYETEIGSLERRNLSNIVSRAQAMRQIALTRMTVRNPSMVFDYSDLYPILFSFADYLIITDNQSWNAMTMVPTGPVDGDLVSHFERLAAWKRQRGLRARVVTISDILANHYGDFRTGSRDLQEVIRNFLKMAQSAWGVAWVLLGGDTDIVPIRQVASDIFGTVSSQATNPPPDNTSFWTGSYLRIHAVNLGDWWGAASTNLLIRPDNGLLIPYDTMGTSSPTTRGWYFTTDNSYNTRTNMPTDFVRVNGPASEINATLQFLYMWNMIPTDLYYSSLVGPEYNQPGRKDWDLIGNGVYGQYAGSNIDGINFTPTVSLGRASVTTAEQASAFVNKVIAYEKFQRPDGTRLDDEWTKRVLLVSENWDSSWGGLLDIWPTVDNPPGNNRYHHPTGAGHSLIKMESMLNWSWSLLANISEGNLRLIPYRTDAGAGIRGWFFATNSTTLTPNTFPVILSSGKIMHLPAPSKWIAVYGAPDELAPTHYVFNQPGLDGSLADQEQLRELLKIGMPGFNNIMRLYQDIVNMTPAQVAAAPLELLTGTRLRKVLNDGPHIVSLSGHGSNSGCCELGLFVADNLTNGYHTFIAYADSCLTNQLDGDAVSEHLISNPNGGAVAYVGNTRFSWVGMGDDYQRRFFTQWSTLGGNAHLGLLCDTRTLLYNSSSPYNRWIMLALHLTGDPEMPLWWRKPLRFRIPKVVFIDKLTFILEDPNPPDPVIDLPYLKNWGLTFVHLRQGQREQLVLANSDNRVDLPLTNFRSGSATLTVTRPGHEPVVQRVKLRNSIDKRPTGRLLIAAFLIGVALGLAVRGMQGKDK